MKGKKAGKIKGLGIDEDEDPTEKHMTKEQKMAYRAGKRRDDSDSDFRYTKII